MAKSQTSTTPERSAAILEMVDELLLLKLELTANAQITGGHLVTFQQALAGEKDDTKARLLRMLVGAALERRAAAEQAINTLEHNIAAYTAMLKKA